MSTNQLSPAALNVRRTQAVKLRLTGQSLDKIERATGLSHPTIIAVYKAFLKGGWPAVPVKERGRPKSNHYQQPAIQSLWQQMHHQHQVDGLWTIDKTRQWLIDNANLVLSNKTIARYIADWDIKAELKKLTKQTHSTNEKIYIAQTITTNSKQHFNADGANTFALCAQSSKGELYWRCFYQYLTEDVLLSFCQCLTQRHTDKTNIILYIQSPCLKNYLKLQHWLANQQTFKLIVLDSSHWQTETPAKKHSADIKQTSIQPSYVRNTMALTHLERLEAESIHIMREVISKTENPVMLYSIGKDSAVMLHLAMKAFYPSKPPFSFLHVDTGWKFREMYDFRDQMVKDLDIDLITYKNPAGNQQDINPFTHGSALHTDIMKTQGLKQALDKYKFDAAFGGARRDEEKSRAKERIFSFRTADHRWDPKNQRPELWKNYNANKKPGESIRVFPISNWTELDIWQYIYLEKIPVVPLYLAAKRPVVERDGTLIMVDDERMPMLPGEVPMMREVRFRTLGCYPLTGAVESTANTVPAIIQEMLLTKTSERQGRMIDKDSFASMEKKKQEGYF